jgi:hypothetical protein
MSIFMWLAYALCFIGMVVCGVGAAVQPRAHRAQAERKEELALAETKTKVSQQAQPVDRIDGQKTDTVQPGPVATENNTPQADALVDSPVFKAETDDSLFSGQAASAAAMATFGENAHQNARFRVRFV